MKTPYKQLKQTLTVALLLLSTLCYSQWNQLGIDGEAIGGFISTVIQQSGLFKIVYL